MKISLPKLAALASLMHSRQLFSASELQSLSQIASKEFVFNEQLTIADSMHFHIHVNDVRNLPNEELFANGAQIVNKASGYIKYAFDGGVNFIFSDIPVSEKESLSVTNETYLDHIGIDIRSEDKNSYVIFQKLPMRCAENGYLFKRQGDGKENVKCCHMQVREKYWVYPEEKINYEFAFGPLIITEGSFGIDLRPANPYRQIQTDVSACCGNNSKKNSVEPNHDLDVQNHRVVSLRYIMKNEQGDVMEDNTQAAPVEYVHGSGNMLTSLEREMLGLKQGEQKSFFLSDSQFSGTIHFDVIIDNVRMATQYEVATGKPVQEKNSVTLQNSCC